MEKNNRKASIAELALEWQNFQEPWYIVENLITKEKTILKGLPGLMLFRRMTEQYGNENCTCLRVKKEIGDVLYGGG